MSSTNCQCVILEGPTPPEYAHVGSHLVEMYANGQGQTWHCGMCRTKCKTRRGRIARLVKSTGIITYTVRQDCECTMVPNGFRHNDLACHRRSYPHGRRRDRAAQVQGGVPLRHPEGGFGAAPAAPQGAASGAAHGSGAEYFSAAAKPKSAATVTVEQVKAAQATMPPNNIRTMPPAATSFQPRTLPQTSPAPATPDFSMIMKAVKQMISEEYGVQPNAGASDVTMEKPLIKQALELEGHSWPVQRGSGIRRLSEHRPWRLRRRHTPRPWPPHRLASKGQQGAIPIPQIPGSESCCTSCNLQCGLSRASPAFSARAFR